MAVAAIGATHSRSLRTVCRAASSISLRYSTLASVQPAASADSSFGEDEKVAKTSGRRSGWAVLLLFLPCAATFGLGTWQLFRRQCKMDMLDYRRTRLKEDPIPLWAVCKEHHAVSPSNGSQTPSLENDVEYRQVLCEGIFDTDKSLYVGPRARTVSGVSQKGYVMVTPLYPTGDSVQPPVLVNRGWVPSSWHEGGSKQNLQAVDQAATLQGKVIGKGLRWWNWIQATQSREETSVPADTVRGVIRSGEQPNMFVPHNDPESGQWFYIDVAAMAHTAGLREGTLLIEAVGNNDALHKTPPIPKNLESLLQSSVMPQDHLNYALTWYSLSAATTYMALKRLKLDRRLRK